LTGSAGGTGPIEVHLPDGGHVIVSFADAMARVNSGIVIASLLAASGSEQDVERAIARDVASVGLRCRVSARRHPTIVSIACR
jgi:hypothetical protein